ncbi:maleylacetoacetate isomerase [Elioraea tepida]|jgi:maleylacetoacetate isomerase|uniref:maleylacetoacetate isomerase n=1 Tax=Elioraea tepida TaxID=2843330 RepID=UPI002E28A507|nr:maleylacetoacetate isomerase [Elioraea tepida]
MTLRLFTYWRSSASYRARIALNLKGLAYHSVPVNLVRDGGEQNRPDYLSRNPQALVPTLEVDGMPLTQSLAIMEWLEETYPQPPLLPREPRERARVRAFALAIACEIAPLSNLAVRRYLNDPLGITEAAQAAWHQHWLARGLSACEAMIASGEGPFCFGTSPTMADCTLVPQLYNARRFGHDLAPYPTLLRAEAAMLALPAVQAAAPEAQADAA